MTDILKRIEAPPYHSYSRQKIAEIARYARQEIERMSAALVAAMYWHERADNNYSEHGITCEDPRRKAHVGQINAIKDALGSHLERIERATANARVLEKIAEHEAEIAKLKAEMV